MLTQGFLLYSNFIFLTLFWCSNCSGFGQWEPLQADSYVLLTHPCHIWAHPYFLAQDSPMYFFRVSPGSRHFSILLYEKAYFSKAEVFHFCQYDGWKIATQCSFNFCFFYEWNWTSFFCICMWVNMFFAHFFAKLLLFSSSVSGVLYKLWILALYLWCVANLFSPFYLLSLVNDVFSCHADFIKHFCVITLSVFFCTLHDFES